MAIRSAQRLIGVIPVLEKRADGLAFLGLLEQEQVSAVDDAQLRTGMWRGVNTSASGRALERLCLE